VASWFETRGLAALLTMRDCLRASRTPHPEEARSAVSKGGPPDDVKPRPRIPFPDRQFLIVIASASEAIQNC
jgi:hypothetical protein